MSFINLEDENTDLENVDPNASDENPNNENPLTKQREEGEKSEAEKARDAVQNEDNPDTSSSDKLLITNYKDSLIAFKKGSSEDTSSDSEGEGGEGGEDGSTGDGTGDEGGEAGAGAADDESGEPEASDEEPSDDTADADSGSAEETPEQKELTQEMVNVSNWLENLQQIAGYQHRLIESRQYGGMKPTALVTIEQDVVRLSNRCGVYVTVESAVHDLDSYSSRVILLESVIDKTIEIARAVWAKIRGFFKSIFNWIVSWIRNEGDSANPRSPTAIIKVAELASERAERLKREVEQQIADEKFLKDEEARKEALERKVFEVVVSMKNTPATKAVREIKDLSSAIPDYIQGIETTLDNRTSLTSTTELDDVVGELFEKWDQNGYIFDKTKNAKVWPNHDSAARALRRTDKSEGTYKNSRSASRLTEEWILFEGVFSAGVAANVLNKDGQIWVRDVVLGLPFHQTTTKRAANLELREAGVGVKPNQINTIKRTFKIRSKDVIDLCNTAVKTSALISRSQTLKTLQAAMLDSSKMLDEFIPEVDAAFNNSASLLSAASLQITIATLQTAWYYLTSHYTPLVTGASLAIRDTIAGYDDLVKQMRVAVAAN